MRRALLPAVLLFASSALAARPAEPAADVAQLGQLAGALELFTRPGDGDADTLQRLATQALAAACEAEARGAGVAGIEEADWDSLRRRAADEARALVRELLEKKGAERLRARADLLRALTSSGRASAIVAEWLGFAPAPPARAPGQAAPSCGAQVSAEASAGDLSVVAPSTRVLEEVGGFGAGNGWLDSGEWARVSFAVRNAGARPWFSASAWLESEDACLWVDPREEHELTGLKASGGEATVDAWIYLSKACPAGPRKLRLQVRDSRRAPEGQSLAVELRPFEAPAPRLAGATFDTDAPGFSDGSNSTIVAPGLRFELSADLGIEGAPVKGASLAFSAPADLGPLFERFALPDGALTRDGDLWSPTSSLEVEIAANPAFRQALTRSKASAHWSKRALRNKLWVAFDATLLVAGPTAADPSSAAAPPPPTAQEVVELVREAILVRARPAAPETSGAIVASTGLEAGLDVEKFAAAYQKRTQPAAPTAEPELAYRYRWYHALPLVPVNDLKPLPPPPPAQEPPPRPAVEKLPIAEAAPAAAPVVARSAPSARPRNRATARVPTMATVTTTKDLNRMLQTIENLAMSGGAPASVVRDVTFSLSVELSKKIGPSWPVDLYPAAILQAIHNGVALGLTKEFLGAQLRAAHLTGELKGP